MVDQSSPAKPKREDTFVMDRAWFKREALEALKLYFAPFAGVYRAFKDPI